MTGEISETELLVLIRSAWSGADAYATDPTTYTILGDYAIHLLCVLDDENTEAFEEGIRLIERLYQHGDTYVREATIIGILETVQNICSHDGTDPERFGRHLLPGGRKGWDQLNAFWSRAGGPVGGDTHTR